MIDLKMSDYFEFLDPDDIRIKGTRVGIETVLNDWFNAFSPEEISVRYPTLTLEQVYATITFYLLNQEEIDGYHRRWLEHAEAGWQQQRLNPSESIARLRKIKLRKMQSESEHGLI